jgi:hypothetical protein
MARINNPAQIAPAYIRSTQRAKSGLFRLLDVVSTGGQNGATYIRGGRGIDYRPMRIVTVHHLRRSRSQRSISVGSNLTNRPTRMRGMRQSRAMLITVLRATLSSSASSSGFINAAVCFRLAISSLLTSGEFDVPPVRTRPLSSTSPRRARKGRSFCIRRPAGVDLPVLQPFLKRGCSHTWSLARAQ